MAGMSPRIKAKKGRFGVDGLPPAVSILTPADGDTVTTLVPFAATGDASDAETGDVTANIVWTSDVDGSAGVNGSPTSLTLTTLGAHVLTASITVGGHTTTTTINLTVAA